MIKTIIQNENIAGYEDDSAALDETTLKAMQAAMSTGLTSFTTPTVQHDQGRNEWKVRQWVTIRDGQPVSFLVACKELSPHFEVMGPEVPLAPPESQPLQSRAAAAKPPKQ